MGPSQSREITKDGNQQAAQAPITAGKDALEFIERDETSACLWQQISPEWRVRASIPLSYFAGLDLSPGSRFEMELGTSEKPELVIQKITPIPAPQADPADIREFEQLRAEFETLRGTSLNEAP